MMNNFVNECTRFGGIPTDFGCVSRDVAGLTGGNLTVLVFLICCCCVFLIAAIVAIIFFVIKKNKKVEDTKTTKAKK